MLLGIIFAVLAALASGVWAVSEQLAAKKIDSLVGAIIVSLTAVVLGLIFLLPRIKATQLYSGPKSFLLVMLAGISALAIDYFALKAYSSGLAVSIAGPIIIGGGVAAAAIIGFLMGDSVTWLKLLGILLVVAGSGILAAVVG